MADRYAFAAPVLPGKTAQARSFAGALMGARKAGYDDLNRRSGVTAEYVFLMETPAGDVIIVHGEGQSKAGPDLFDPATREFDRWFRDQVLTITGVDVLEVSGEPSELLAAWHSS